MSSIAHHLVRRGIEATHQNYYQGSVETTDDGQDGRIKRIPIWGIALLWTTLLLFIFAYFVVS